MSVGYQKSILAATYGGEGWSPRTQTLGQEMGTLWGDWGQNLEWAPLKAVLLHRPGPEVDGLTDPDAVQMLDTINIDRFCREHDALVQAYRDAGVEVYYLAPDEPVTPNSIFCADLFFMTPQGAILARPASTVRAGEERLVARRLAALDVPILMSVHEDGVFEGADAVWIDEGTAIVATGLRTNKAGADQVEWTLHSIGADVVRVDLPYGSMHLMGTLRLAGPGIAIGFPGQIPHQAVRTLREQGYHVLWAPDMEEIGRLALNFVSLGPNKILMAANCPHTQAMYEDAGIECITVEIGELGKAAGGMGCLTGVLKREKRAAQHLR